jgi:hypothetical protein
MGRMMSPGVSSGFLRLEAPTLAGPSLCTCGTNLGKKEVAGLSVGIVENKGSSCGSERGDGEKSPVDTAA